MDRNEYDRGKCQVFFQVYRDCKRAWVRLVFFFTDALDVHSPPALPLYGLVGDDAALGEVEQSTSGAGNSRMSARLQCVD